MGTGRGHYNIFYPKNFIMTLVNETKVLMVRASGQAHHLCEVEKRTMKEVQIMVRMKKKQKKL